MFQGTGALAFDAAFYLQQNPDVSQAILNGTFQGSALDHFVQFGQFEGRDPNQFFDTEFYLAQNPDVLAAIADPANASVTSAFQHFVDFGFSEGTVRAPSAELAFFNPQTYLAQNPDLQAAFGDLEGQALNNRLFQHFVEFGVNENRPGTGVVLETIALTTGIDTITGTAGNDVFSAVISAPTEDSDGADVVTTTLQTGDQINGGAGIDTLRIVASTTNDEVPAPRLVNVERVEVTTSGGNTANLGLQNSTGVQTLALLNSTGSVAVTGATAALDLIHSNSSGNIDLAYGAGVVGAAFAQDVALANATGGNISVTGATTFNLDVSGDNTLATLNGTDLTTVNVTGAGALEIEGALASTVATLNATGNTGGVDVDLSNASKDLTVTGGSGDDRFVLGTLGAKDTVNGGAGFDTVVVDGGDLSSETAAAPFRNLTGVERVEFNGSSATTLDGATFNNASITNLLFNLGEGANITIDNAGSARTYEFGSSPNESGSNGDAFFNMKDGATTLNLVLLGDEDSAADVDDVTVTLAEGATGVATINLASVGSFEDDSNDIDVITAVAGSTINITGSADLDIQGFTNRIVLNASSFEGDLTFSGSTAGDTITLGGSGQTTIEFFGGDSGVATTTANPTIVNFDVITGFNAGEGGDVLDFAGSGGEFVAVSAEAQAAISSSVTLLDAFQLAAADIADAGWTAFTFNGQTYAAFSDGADSVEAPTDPDAPVPADTFSFGEGDVVIQLNGVSVADLDTTNFTTFGLDLV